MAQTAANLTERVLPDVPLRQFVLTLPHPLRPLVAYDRELSSRIYAIFYDSIQRFYRQRLAERSAPAGRTGSVTAIQRASSDLRLNPHLHGVFLDGVFVERRDDDGDGDRGALEFVALPELSDMDVAELLQTIAARVRSLLRRQGVLSDDDAALGVEARADTDEERVLAALGTAASFGQPLAGPESRPGRVPGVVLAPALGARTDGLLCASDAGFSLHAATTVSQGDKPGRERLIKYILRPPVSAERIERLDDQRAGRVRLRLKRPFSDGTWAIEMDELSLCARLAALVPPPWQHQVRYSGVLAPASKWRARIVPRPAAEPDATANACGHRERPPPQLAAGSAAEPSELLGRAPSVPPDDSGCRYWPWRILKARTFGADTTVCRRCGGELALRALVHEPASIRRMLTHLGLPTDVPTPAPARGPPYYRGQVRRLRPADPGDTQQPLCS
jgi:hypothetical protein